MKSFSQAFDGAAHDALHTVKFYESDAQLVAAVRRLVDDARCAGDGLVLVATSAHQSAMLSGGATRGAPHGGPIVVLSAQETLDELMPGGELSAVAFRRVVGTALDRASRSATGKVRAFGEMVDLLARQGRIEDALRLEEMWNELIAETGVSLLCGYCLASFPQAADAAAFRAVCDSHSHVAPTVAEDGMAQPLARRLASLEQQALGAQSALEGQRTLAARLAASEQALESAHKLGAAAIQSARIGSELSNLLTTILWGTDALLDPNDPASEGEARHIALEIRRAARTAGTLARSLKTLGSDGNGETDLVDANEVASTLHSFFEPMANPHHRFELELCGESPFVAIDRGLLEQITLTLLVNARAGLGHGGRVVLRTRHVDVDVAGAGDVTLPRGRYVEITVTDSSASPGSASLGRMFEPFLTTTAGSIGLSTVYKVVHHHGGTILVESSAAQGSTFRVLLPSASRRVSPLRRRDGAPSSSAGGRRLQVVVADDEPLIRRFIARSFRAWGYDVVEAHDGATAIALGALLPHVDLLVVDAGIPRASGPDVALELFQIHPSLVVVFVSGESTDALERCALPSDRCALVAKPFDRGGLHETARMLLERHRQPPGLHGGGAESH